jgi:molecular chaperone GrpE
VVQNALASLEKQIQRAGREQLKANSLAETQLERLTAALDMLRENEARREKEIADVHNQIDEARAAARMEMVHAILPALDGIDEALRSGQHLLTKPAEEQASLTIFERLRVHVPSKPGSDRKLSESLESWLVGLTFVRQRLLDVLEAEGVRPIAAQGQPFDPQVHVVMDVVPTSEENPPGVVVQEMRRGYIAGTRVLRHAEVVVAKPEEDA